MAQYITICTIIILACMTGIGGFLAYQLGKMSAKLDSISENIDSVKKILRND